MAYRSYEDHIVDLMVTLGERRFVGINPMPWDVTVGKMLDDPNRQITVYRNGGLSPDPKWLIDYPSIQVKVRGGPNDYQTCDERANILFSKLVGRDSYTADNGDRIVHINAIGDVGFTGWDDKKRPEFVFNLRLITEPFAANRPNTDREQL